MNLSELYEDKREKLGKKSLKNEKVRVRDMKKFEEIMKRCKKERVIVGRGVWKNENEGKGREIFDYKNFENERNKEKGGLIEKSI